MKGGGLGWDTRYNIKEISLLDSFKLPCELGDALGSVWKLRKSFVFSKKSNFEPDYSH